MTEGTSESSEEKVFLEFYSLEDGSDKFTIVLSQEDFESYKVIAENMGIPVEDFVLDIAAAQEQEKSTQWVTPRVDEEGNIDLDTGTPFELPDEEKMTEADAKIAAAKEKGQFYEQGASFGNIVRSSQVERSATDSPEAFERSVAQSSSATESSFTTVESKRG